MLFLARKLPHRIYTAGIVPVFLFLTCLAQEKQIKGVITTETNIPLFGATISVKSSDNKAITDSAGLFTMHVNAGDVLLISYNGYKSKELKITNQTALTISLPQSAINFDEILMPGSTSRKKEIKGSVIAVKPKDRVAVPPATEEKMLQGRVAGLAVVTCVEPGAPADIRLHGVVSAVPFQEVFL